MAEAFICAAVRTPIGRYGGALAAVRTDDLAALPVRALLARHPGLDPAAVDDVILGCANQAGEDNRNVARMAALLAGLPASVPGATVNRLCGSGMDAIGIAARAIRAGEAELADRRRGREHEPRAVRPRQGGERVRARGRALRHDHRLALRQPRCSRRSTAPTRCPRRPRTSPRTSRSGARIRTRSRSARSSGPRPRSEAGRLAEEIVPVEVAGAARRAARGRSRRASAPRDDAREARRAANAVPRRAAR